MKIIKTKSYEDMSQLCLNIIVSSMLQDKQVNLSLTGGETPKHLYELLTKECNKTPGLLTKVNFFGFDECFVDNKGITLEALNNQIYDKIKVKKENIFSITEENYLIYDNLIDKQGGIDLMVIGLGSDGHFCGNMPRSTYFDRETHRVRIKKEYPWYQTIESFFKEMMPDYIYTMGPASIMKVKHLVLIVNGEHKQEAIKRLIEGEISTDFPASVLRMHPNLTIIIDEDASKLIT